MFRLLGENSFFRRRSIPLSQCVGHEGPIRSFERFPSTTRLRAPPITHKEGIECVDSSDPGPLGPLTGETVVFLLAPCLNLL